MFGIGTFEFLVIIVVAVLVLGPEHLPRVMRTVTKVMSDFRRVSTEFQRAINLEANKEDYRQQHGEAAFEAANKALKPKKKKKKKAVPPDASAAPAPVQAQADISTAGEGAQTQGKASAPEGILPPEAPFSTGPANVPAGGGTLGDFSAPPITAADITATNAPGDSSLPLVTQAATAMEDIPGGISAPPEALSGVSSPVATADADAPHKDLLPDKDLLPVQGGRA